MARPNDRPAAPKHSEIVGVLSLASGSGGFFKYVAAPILTGAISGLAAGGLLLILSPAITESIVQPTCSNPRNLVLKPVSIGPIPSAEGNYAVSNLVDGRTASVWVPPREAEAATPVTFTFDRNVDLQLICVVNGLPTDQASYDRANKVRALKVGTDATAGRRDPGHAAPGSLWISVHESVHELLPTGSIAARTGAFGSSSTPGCRACGRQHADYGSEG